MPGLLRGVCLRRQNQIKIFINLEIIGEEDNQKKKFISIFFLFFFLNLKNFCNLVKPLDVTIATT